MNDVIKVAATGIMAAICAIVVRKQAPELAILLAVSAGAMILLLCSGVLSSVLEFMDKLAEASGILPDLMVPLIKVTGIGVITRLSADFCRDAKEGGLATAVEAAGSLLALLTVIPLMSAVLSLLSEML